MRPAALLLFAHLAPGCGGGGGGEAPVASTPAGAAPGSAGAARLPEAASADRAIALTFDDLPGVAVGTGGCDPGALGALNDRLLAVLERNDVPAVGLVTGSRMCDGAPADALLAIYRAWLEDGHTLGNHTFSHRDLNQVELDWYTADIERNERLLEGAREGRHARRWFRAPFLHYGDTRAKHAGLVRWLAANDYTVARVSVDNQEWVFADVYARAKARGDSAVMTRVGEAYIPFMDSVLAFFEARTTEVLGRYPPQVLLLHVNELNADRMDALVAMIRSRGYRLIPMEEALSDPWYAEPDGYVGPRGLAWLHRRASTEGAADWPEEPREPAWLAELQRGYR